MADSPTYIGVDIGGTKVAAGLVTADGHILHKTRNDMRANGTAEEGLACVRTAIDDVLNANSQTLVAAIGLSSPGPVDINRGMVINPSNLPCWRNFPLGDAIAAAYHLPTKVHNDANAAALAEAHWGAGAGYKHVFYATIGTGIGTGIVYNGHVYLGRTGSAAEGGHMTIDYKGDLCHCGKRGCIEILAAGPAIANRARAKLASTKATSRVVELAAGDPSRITGEIVGQAWRDGDALATEVLQDTADVLAIWLGNIIDLIEPDVIVVGGGVSHLVAAWFDRIREKLPAWSVNTRCGEIPLREAKYRNDSGIAGAAALCATRRPYF